MARVDTGDCCAQLDCPDNRYPSVGALHAPAIRLERAARDLFGLDPVGLPDTRPWLDMVRSPTAYPFLPVEGESLHQIPVGPVHAGIIEPGHFRFTADGETVVRLEQRLGYVHKGIDHLMHGATLEQARASPAAPRATARSPTHSPSPGRSRRRLASSRRPVPCGCAA